MLDTALMLDTAGAAGNSNDTMAGITSVDNVGGHPKWSKTDSKRMRLGATQTTCNAGCSKTVPRGTSERRKQDGLIAWLMHSTLATILVGKAKAWCYNIGENSTMNPSTPDLQWMQTTSIQLPCKGLHLQSLPLRPLLERLQLFCSLLLECAVQWTRRSWWVFIMPIPR